MQTSSRLKVGLSMPPTAHSSSASSARNASFTRLCMFCIVLSPVTTMDGRIGAAHGGGATAAETPSGAERGGGRREAATEGGAERADAVEGEAEVERRRKCRGDGGGETTDDGAMEER